MQNKEHVYTNFITVTTLIFLSEIIIVHIIRNDLNPFSTPLSFYAVGNYGMLISSGLIFIAIDYVLLGILFNKANISRSKPVMTGIGILIFVSANTCALTIFQTDTGSIHSLTGKIHVITAHLHFAFLPVSAFLLYAGLKKECISTYRNTTLVFAICLETGILVLVFKATLHVQYYSGLIQKAIIVMILGWIFYSARTLKGELEKQSVRS